MMNATSLLHMSGKTAQTLEMVGKWSFLMIQMLNPLIVSALEP